MLSKCYMKSSITTFCSDDAKITTDLICHHAVVKWTHKMGYEKERLLLKTLYFSIIVLNE